MRPFICDPNARKEIIRQLVSTIRERLGSFKPNSFAEICEKIQLLEVRLEKKHLDPALADSLDLKLDSYKYKLYLQGYHKFCYHHWRPEDIRNVSFPRFKGNNTGILLWGERGCGKSQILSYTTAWAHENNWMNVTISYPDEFINLKHKFFRFKNGLYLQQELATQILSNIKTSNEQLLNEIDVDMSRYGLYDISGVRDGDPEPCPRTWDPVRKCWSDDWKDFLYDAEIQHYENIYETMEYRLSDKVPDPKKLIEIADYGL